MTVFNNRINILMAESKKTIRQVAKEAGVNKSNLATWLTTDTMPNSKSIILLCRYFNVSADWLLGLSNYRQIRGQQYGNIH